MRRIAGLTTLLLLLAVSSPVLAQPLPIGEIQGAADESARRGDWVTFRGVVTAVYEDRNTRGVTYYTLFVQDLPGQEDGDPATSDGIAVFLGRRLPTVGPGAQVLVSGAVTEFYGLTEIDDRDLGLTVEATGVPLPEPVALDPPADMIEQAAAFEALEGMRAVFEDAVVIGPAYEGCGFAVADAGLAVDGLPPRFLRRDDDDPVGQAVPVLWPSDVDCETMPAVKTGDRLGRVTGVVTYNFDQFKLLLDDPDAADVEPSALPALSPLPALQGAQFSLATLNTADTFDAVHDTTDEGEPVPSEDEVAVKRAKLAAGISSLLGCPTLLGVQEVEHEALLLDLAAELAGPCGFTYQVTHRESPDGRGIDNALLSDPRRVVVAEAALRQACSPVPTDVSDPGITCEGGEMPLFGRPPLEVRLAVDGRPLAVFVNHFKSKRGGDEETDLQRLAQARYQAALTAAARAAGSAVVVLGDFNDTEGSDVVRILLEGSDLAPALAGVPDDERYSYNFGGVSELIDGVLVSPDLAAEGLTVGIVHANADFPAAWERATTADLLPRRFSDHDVPWVIVGLPPAPTPTVAAATPTLPPSATPSPAPATATAVPPAGAVAATATAIPLPTPVPAATAMPAAGRSAAGGWMWPMVGGLGVAALAGMGLLLTRRR